MFWKLYNYIGGDNGRNQEIAMTTPVLMEYETKSIRMNFFVPPNQAGSLPKPTEQDVKITSIPPICVYVRWYGGKQKAINQKVKELREALKVKGLQGKYDEYSMMSAGYDSPMARIRHNEVMVKKLN